MRYLVTLILLALVGCASTNTTDHTATVERYAATARTALTVIRNPVTLERSVAHFEFQGATLRMSAFQANLSLQDLGTAEEELAYIRKRVYMNEAAEWLDELRDNTLPARFVIERIRNLMRRGGFTLHEIGSTESELRKFERRNIRLRSRWMVPV